MKNNRNIRLAVLVLLVAMMAIAISACGSTARADSAMSQSDTTTAEPESAPFAGVIWEWQETQSSDDSTLEVDDPSQYTLEFFEDGRLAVKADCNLVQGTYTVDGASLKIELGPMTMAACPPESLSDQYLEQLSYIVSYVLEDETLHLNMFADGGNMVFAPGSEEAPAEGAEAETAPFVGPVWEWQKTQSMDDTTLEVDDPSQYTLEFFADGSMAVKADCNLVQGSYTVEASSLTFQFGPMTAAACPPDSLSDKFLEQLGFIRSYVMQEGNLYLAMMADGGIMEFAPVSDEEMEAPDHEDADADGDGEAHEEADTDSEKEADTDADTDKDVIATYHALLPSDDSPGRFIKLTLYEDGTLQLVSDYLNDDPEKVEVGFWTEDDGTVTITITGTADEAYDEPIIVTLDEEGDNLTSVDHDVKLYGEQGLPFRKRVAITSMLADVKRAFITIDLDAGFALDPFFVSVNGGGELDASTLGEGCSGYIHHDPVVSVDWEGDATFLEAFFFSDHDPTMVVRTPDGEYLCSDDANPLLLDPVVEIPNPAKGAYDIWVGSYDENQLLPGLLVLTTRPEVNLGTFILGDLIQRPSIPEILHQAAGEVTTELLAEALDSYEGVAGALSPSDQDTVEVEVTSEGDIPAFDIPMLGRRCTGFVSDVPDYVFGWSGAAQELDILFEGDVDSSLIVVTPDGQILCNDDAATSENINPRVIVANPAKGDYAIYVGRLDPSAPVTGLLIVTDDAGTLPEVLEPAPAGQ